MTAQDSSPDVVAVALPRLLKTLNVERCTFYEVPIPAPVERRGRETKILAEVSDLTRGRKRTNDSFVEILLDIAAEKGLSDHILDAASFHQPLKAATRSYDQDVSELTAASLEQCSQSVPSSQILVFSSLVLTADGLKHLPMLDYKLPRSSENDKAAVAVAKFAGGGMVLASGSSYHYYGNSLLEQRDFEEWLLHCQLLSRYVDARWITHQLIERQAALRVSHHGRSEPPTVIAYVD